MNRRSLRNGLFIIASGGIMLQTAGCDLNSLISSLITTVALDVILGFLPLAT